MEDLVAGVVIFSLGVYFADPVRKAVPVLDPNKE